MKKKKKSTKDSYSLYEAKTQLSAIVRQVREGQTVTVTLHGEPAVEIRPVARSAETTEEWFNEMVERGIFIPAKSKIRDFKMGAPVPGALARFLADRD